MSKPEIAIVVIGKSVSARAVVRGERARAASRRRNDVEPSPSLRCNVPRPAPTLVQA